MNLKEVIEKKGKLLELLREAATAEDYDQVKVDTINDDIQNLDKQKRSIETMNKVLAEREDTEIVEKGETTFGENLGDFIRGGEGDIVTDYRGNPVKGKKSFSLMGEKRANQWYKGTDNKGGYLVPDEIGKKIQEAQAFIGGMVTPGLCNWIQTSTGRKIEIPTVDDTSTKAEVIDEKTSMATGNDVTYGTGDLDFYKITSLIVKVSNELIQDAAFDVVGHVTSLLFERIYRGLNYYFTQGTSGSHPVGINTLSTKGVDAAAARAITRTNLSDLVYSVNRAYRVGASFQMNDDTVKAVRALYVGSTDANPLWTDSMRAGEPNSLEGYPVIVNPDIDDIAPYDRPVFFGDWKRYYIGEGLPIKLIRLDELYAATDEVGFNVLGRWAGNLIAYTGDAPIKHIRNAST